MAAESVTFTASYSVDSGLILSAAEVVFLFLTDIPLRGLGGEKMPDLAIEEKVRSETEKIENFLSIKIPKQIVSEKRDFVREEFAAWGFLIADYLVNEVLRLEGKINNVSQVTYPKEWASTRGGMDVSRNIYIVPAANAPTTDGETSVLYTGQFPLFAYLNGNHVPNYWSFDYDTGWDEVPKDITDAIGKLATIQILAILGDITFGAGIASKSLSFDGLSQSISTTQSAENSLYSARIRQYQKELDASMKLLKGRYGGIPLIVA